MCKRTIVVKYSGLSKPCLVIVPAATGEESKHSSLMTNSTTVSVLRKFYDLVPFVLRGNLFWVKTGKSAILKQVTEVFCKETKCYMATPPPFG